VSEENLARSRKASGIFTPSMHTPEKGHGKLWWTAYKEHTTSTGIITVVILCPGNKEKMSVNTAL